MSGNEYLYDEWLASQLKKERDIETRTALDKESKREITVGQIEFIKTCTTDIVSGQADYKEDIVVYLRTIIETQKNKAVHIQYVIDTVLDQGKVG